MERTTGWTSSTEPRASARVAAVQPPERVVVGRILGAHGLRGRVRVRVLGGDRENLLQMPRVFVGADEDGADLRAFEVEAAAPGRPDEVRLALAGIRRREEAEDWKGRLVWADPRDFEALPPGEYYGYQLVGCRVETQTGRPIGTVRDIWSAGPTDLLVVEEEGGIEHLIPAARDFLREVDVESLRIVIEVIPGLLLEE